MSELAKKNYVLESKLELQKVEIEKLIDEKFDIQRDVHKAYDLMQTLIEDNIALQKKIDDLENDNRDSHKEIENLKKLLISQFKLPMNNVKSESSVVSSLPNGASKGLISIPMEEAEDSNDSGNDTLTTLDKETPKLSMKDNNGEMKESFIPVPTIQRPTHYEPVDKRRFNEFLSKNKICVADLCNHYGIKARRSGGRMATIECIEHHTHCHATHFKLRYPFGYSQFAALCQVSSDQKSCKDFEVKMKLYEAILNNDDSFFSPLTYPTE